MGRKWAMQQSRKVHGQPKIRLDFLRQCYLVPLQKVQ
ncbi:hypothetical protein IHE45_11G042200 [Dioscorea alata]|uniref:Uncharacterized protein n=1 Tax=Dioscorea alata TaxID=55571 RepID=A0ACB7V6I7_DIOAL|nr:hypothetical protein IHE45_11G042200 [Dioscorea alata]